ncbi:MAG TPA: class I tRNA ligase family protein, partial [Oscillospiraceae bacterium]|nr:class I tRNA ligase family protein [Oscillospiraceae bacterium]
RCKKPIIYRATEQWFASVDAIKDAAVNACDGVWWNPEWGKERMVSMIRERADWCISRQRQWGVPIPIFYCAKCGKEHIDKASIRAVSDLFRREGSNAWFSRPASEILPEGTVCKHCGGTEFTKESDIMDVWFDSGSTQTSVLQQRPELRFPADLYLEGGDQYRGWFQSSLLTSIAANGKAPFRQIVTHGWTVDGEGKAMHKSLGNAVAPEEIIKDYGADILRLWVSSADYRQDMRISKEILRQLSDAYLKIRNTCRYILGNLSGFDPDDQVPLGEMTALDRFALSRLNALVEKVRAAYDVYEFHTVYRGIYNFCVVDLSNLYLDILKDRLYCEAPGSLARRSAQTAIYRILDGLVRMLAPLLAFTTEEIWAAMPHQQGAEAGSVLFNDMPAYDPSLALSDEEAARWEALLALRTDVNRALESARAAKTIGKSLEAEVTLSFTAEAARRFETIRDFPLTDLLIVSAVHVSDKTDGMAGEDFPGLTVHVAPSAAPKCVRCWNHRQDVGTDAAHPALCARCAGVVRSL